MTIGRVIGDIVSTHKHPTHFGQKLLIVQPVDLDGSDRGAAVVAVDAFGAGTGDRVLLSQEGFCAFSSVGQMLTPIDAAVLGIVDEVEVLPELGVFPDNRSR
ncbi:MAG TPA: EutN/CcmL family microcompartment protein [Bryobacteraceae bacterium]|nr:EutN/CcmL family microcompartment protein [Bryobacteraceae bacterium]